MMGKEMANWNYEVFWKEALDSVQKERDEQEYTMWFSALRYESSNENVICLSAPSSFYRDQVKTRYEDYLEEKLLEISGQTIKLDISVRPHDPQKQSDENIIQTSASAKSAKSEASRQLKREKGAHPQLSPDYTFDKFVVGENNNFAANAAMAAARNPGTAYNPLLIYGGVGLGKTHLMQAIGNSIYKNSDLKIIYVSTETILNEYVKGIQENNMSAFNKKYRFTDVLLIDDIQFLEKKPGLQDELFHTFNALYDSNKQMVFASDRPAQELKNITERLRTRLGSGTNADLQPPDFETRCAILHKDAENRGKIIPDDVISLVAKNISSNVRDLKAAFKTLVDYCDLAGKPMTTDIARQRLRDAFSSPQQSNVSIDNIIRVTADYFSLSQNDLKGKKRSKNVVQARQLAMYIAHKITEYSTTEVGQAFGGRDHTTVIHSYKQVEDGIKANPTLYPTIQTLIRNVKDFASK
jgi:chromosomal replication initiator protein